MEQVIRTIYRNGQIELPPEVQLPDNTCVTVILPDDLAEDAAPDPAFSIHDLAQGYRTRGSLPQLGTLPLRPSKTMNSVWMWLSSSTVQSSRFRCC